MNNLNTPTIILDVFYECGSTMCIQISLAPLDYAPIISHCTIILVLPVLLWSVMQEHCSGPIGTPIIEELVHSMFR